MKTFAKQNCVLMRLCIELFDYCGEHFKIKFLDNKFQVNKSGNIFISLYYILLL